MSLNVLNDMSETGLVKALIFTFYKTPKSTGRHIVISDFDGRREQIINYTYNYVHFKLFS